MASNVPSEFQLVNVLAIRDNYGVSVSELNSGAFLRTRRAKHRWEIEGSLKPLNVIDDSPLARDFEIMAIERVEFLMPQPQNSELEASQTDLTTMDDRVRGDAAFRVSGIREASGLAGRFVSIEGKVYAVRRVTRNMVYLYPGLQMARLPGGSTIAVRPLFVGEKGAGFVRATVVNANNVVSPVVSLVERI